MRYWGKNIEIDGSFYSTPLGKNMLLNPTEMAYMKASGNPFMNEGNVEIFETKVQDIMRDIEANPVGKILIEAINQTSSNVRIIPLTLKEQNLGKNFCANPIGNNVKGYECVIWYEPWSRTPNVDAGSGISPHQILVHELQHALRQMRNRPYYPGPLGSPAFPNGEELFSVTIENIYLSAGGQPQRMLGAYNQGVPLGGRTDVNFYNEYRKELEVWCGGFPDMTAKLETMHGIWNPIRVRKTGK